MKVLCFPLLALFTLLCTCGRAQSDVEATTGMVVEINHASEALSAFHGKQMHVDLSILLPSGYEKDENKYYPVRYNIAGYGGRHTRVNKLLKNESFLTFWTAAEAPQVITVFLDGDGPFGDPYQLNSENSGPYGDILINEIIPIIDAKYRTLGAKARFTDGCSTGGWVSLALQLIYPDEFSGCYSFSPDPVSFHRMQLIDIYNDENAFINKHGYERPSKRDRYGEPAFSIKKEVSDENKKGPSGTYVDSGSQWGSWNALYSPRGEDGLPVPVFHPTTGVIDHTIAKQWEKYDLLKMVSANWSELGPKVQGKIYVWMGDMDNYYLNNALRDFDAFLKKATNPTSDAIIEFEAMKGHCDEYSHMEVLQLIGNRSSAE